MRAYFPFQEILCHNHTAYLCRLSGPAFFQARARARTRTQHAPFVCARTRAELGPGIDGVRVRTCLFAFCALLSVHIFTRVLSGRFGSRAQGNTKVRARTY